MDTARAARYRIVFDRLSERFIITDDALGGAACRLVDPSGHPKLLTFRNAKGARQWLTAMK